MFQRHILIPMIIALGVMGVFFIFRIGGIENQFLSSSVISTPSLEAMNKDQLQDYINQQQILLSQATSLTKTYQKNIDTARLLFDSLMYNTQFSACAVSYVYKKISEEMLTSNISTSSQSAATNSGVDDFSGDLTAKPTKKIQDSVDVDFIFSQPSLEAQYLNSANNVRLIYDRASRSIKGQFDVGDKTHICRPLVLTPENDTFAGIACNAEKGQVLACDNNTVYGMSYECNNTSYTYILNKCSPSVTPLTLNGALSPVKPVINQPVTFTVTPTGGDGTYTYVWSGTDGLTGTTGTATKTYTTAGTKTANVTVTSAGQSKTLTLTALVTPSLTVSVRATSPTGSTILQKGQSATLTATVSGGTAPYTYSWSGSESLSGTTASIKKLYTTAGSKTVTVTIMSADGKRGEYTMNVNVIEPPLPKPPVLPLSVVCNPLIDKNGRTVTWSARVSGGPSTTYAYKWSLNGESGVPRSTMMQSTNTTISRTYVTGGTKTATVEVKSSTQTITRSCTVKLPTTLLR